MIPMGESASKDRGKVTDGSGVEITGSSTRFLGMRSSFITYDIGGKPIEVSGR